MGTEGDGPSAVVARVRALEALLVEKGYVDPEALDALVETYEAQVGPHNGASVVARAWTDPEFRTRLFAEPRPTLASLGFTGRAGEVVVPLENLPGLHNVVVCTLCSCYPWPLLGLPPAWYKSAAYRSRVVADPRSVLPDFGLELPADTQIRVWDATSEVRYFVVPVRPAGTEGWPVERLAALVTRDSMIGTGVALTPGQVPA